MTKVIRILGYVLLAAGVGLILIGILGTWMSRGFGAVQDLLSPFNIINWITMILTLAPGFLLLMWADRRSASQQHGHR
jgi:hypothetical protein